MTIFNLSRNLQVWRAGITIRVMQKQKGFTLVELVVVIVFMGIMTTIAAPSFKNWQRKQQFETDSQQTISLIADARAAAMADKRCDGSQTEEWVTRFDDTGMTLLCEPGNKTISFFPWESEAVILLETAEEDYAWGEKASVDVSIFPGGTQSRINSLYADKWVRISLSLPATEQKSVVCFSSIANYPFISPSEQCDE